MNDLQLRTECQAVLDQFDRLPPVCPHDIIGLWKGQGIPSGHPLDGVLENLNWFGKRFTPDGRADALLFKTSSDRLIPLDPKGIPLKVALRFSALGRTTIARRVFPLLQRYMCARGTIAAVKVSSFRGIESAAMLYDQQPIIDHFRCIDRDRVMGAMTVAGDDRSYFFFLTRVEAS